MAKRLDVLKTYKLYIGGKFSRTESGRYFKAEDQEGNTIANLCRASRKDFRNAVVAARKAQLAWSERTAYNRGQILYRLAENLESRKAEVEEILIQEKGDSKGKAKEAIEIAIDQFIHYAGWADKYQAVFSSVNPVASSHFNFSILEPVGLVASATEEEIGLVELLSSISACIVGGNTMVIQVPQNLSRVMMTLAEIIHHSDVPAGVINILTGFKSELLEHMAGHMDVNTFLYLGDDKTDQVKIEKLSELNLKRTISWSPKRKRWNDPYMIYDLQEVKTTWHPIELIGGASSSY